MNYSWLTLRDLEYLVNVARLEHFGKAADACHVSQPALSAQIKKIEDGLGVELFERTSRRVKITDAGRRIVDQANLVLQEAQKLVALAKTDEAPLTGSLRLGSIATLGPYYVPHFLGPLKRAYPKLELILREGLTDGLLAELRSGNLDAVIAARTFDSEGLKVFSLFHEPFYLAAPKGHPLAEKANLSPADLRVSDMILLEDGHCLKDQTLEFCPTNRRGNIRQYHVASLETLRHLAASGLGYTLIPALAVNESDSMGKLLTYRTFASSKRVGREIVLVCRERSSRIRDIEALAAFLRRNIPKKLANTGQ